MGFPIVPCGAGGMSFLSRPGADPPGRIACVPFGKGGPTGFGSPHPFRLGLHRAESAGFLLVAWL